MNIKWDASKPFTIQFCLFFLFLLIAGLNLALNNMGASGFFTEISAVFLIYALGWGFYPNPRNVRKRNFLRILFFLGSHAFTHFFIGGSKGIVALCQLNHPTKTAETISKTYFTIEAIKDTAWSILKFESVNFEKILWVYVVLFIGFSIPVYKVLRSWGWPCVITAGLTITLAVLLINFWAFFTMPWNWVCIGLVVLFGMLALYFGKQTYYTPTIA